MFNATKLFTTAALSAALVLGQGAPGGRERGTPPTAAQRIEMKVNFLTTLLTLTTDQKAKATTIFSEAHASGENSRTASQTTRDSLEEAVKKNDVTAIDRLAATLGSLSGQHIAIDSKAQAAFYALLTADQKAKFDSMPHGGPGGHMGGHGMGGMRGFGPRR